MGQLPNGYISADWLGGSSCYFDTGVYPSSNLDITGLFYLNYYATATYVFGARNSNSNTSAGQINFLHNASGSCYIGYQSARLTLNENVFYGQTYIHNKANEFNVLSQNMSVFEKTGSTTSFTGTRTMYLLALNNAGNVNYGTNGTSYYSRLKAFRIEQNGTIIHEYAPCYDEANAVFGLYDFVDETFLTDQGSGTFATLHLLEVQSTTGGEAYIRTENAGNVSKQYRWGISNEYVQSPIIAAAKKGYAFLNWTDGNGNVVSSDEIYYPIIETDTVLTANFVKIAESEQNNRYQLLGLQYGVSYPVSASAPDGNESNIYALVNDFTCRDDTLARSTTTIEVESVPSLFQANIPVFLISPRGRVLWCGIIQTISGTTITCREAMSMFDMEMMCGASTSIDGDDLTDRSILYGAWMYYIYWLSCGNNSVLSTSNKFISRYRYTLNEGYSRRVNFEPTKNIVSSFPLITSKEVVNVEDKLFELFDQFGMIVKASLGPFTVDAFPEKGAKNLLKLHFFNPREYETLVVGTNSEAISNVNIDIENQNYTTLMVFSTAGAFRGEYGMKTDGVISQFDDNTAMTGYIAYNQLKNKVVMSDDKTSTLAEQYLGNAMLNHKISFNVDLTQGSYRFGDFELGRSVYFYDGDQLYKSVITAKEFSYADGKDDVTEMKVTLGNVRTNLTAKINLGKVGKKRK